MLFPKALIPVETPCAAIVLREIASPASRKRKRRKAKTLRKGTRMRPSSKTKRGRQGNARQPKTAYNFFQQVELERLSRSDSDGNNAGPGFVHTATVAKLIGKNWMNLTKEEKIKFERKAAVARSPLPEDASAQDPDDNNLPQKVKTREQDAKHNNETTSSSQYVSSSLDDDRMHGNLGDYLRAVSATDDRDSESSHEEVSMYLIGSTCAA
jgi:hypothetical protein